MKKAITQLFSMALAITLTAQTADFENFNLTPDQYLNGSDGSGGFESGSIFFPNSYNDIWQTWSGWAISNTTDTQTPGWGNQYSAIAGGGANNSPTYAVSFVDGHSIAHAPGDPLDIPVFVDVTNNTYAYWSMLDGDNYAKKFGGVDGNDPDFFLLTIKGYLNGAETDDSIDFYLADYRFDDNSMDYIVNDWETIELNSLGHVDSLSFTLTSSDVGSFGMNTPAYFCLDNLTFELPNGTNDQLLHAEVKIFPNPTTDHLSIEWKESQPAAAFVFSAYGHLVKTTTIAFGLQTLNVQALPAGSYFLKIQTEEGWVSKQFVKG